MNISNISEKIKNVSVIGAGSWGTTIAKVIAETHPHINIKIWAFEKKSVSSINDINENIDFLSGIKLPGSIKATHNIHDAVTDSDIIIFATPSKAVSDIAKKIEKHIKPGVYLGSLTKGFCKYNDKVLTISEMITLLLPSIDNRIAAIYGPSHAEEVSTKYHTCLNVASKSEETRKIFAWLLSCDYLQCRETSDIIGVELGGTLKNPAAVAAGMISVLPGCGDNIAGALISESLKEMKIIGECFDINQETLIDISGLGDLVATALSEHSRNRRFGRDIATQILENKKPLTLIDRFFLKIRPSSTMEKIGSKMSYLAEGAYAIEPIIELANKKDLSIPVYRSLYEVLLNRKDPSLLIETIKNPRKFDELYRKSRKHADNLKGFEKMSGRIFSEMSADLTVSVLSDDSIIDNTIESLKNYVESIPATSIELSESEKILSLNYGNFNKKIKSLSLYYYNLISDNFNGFTLWLSVKILEILKIVFHTSGVKQNFSVTGNISRIGFIQKSGTLLYIARQKGMFDFIYPMLALKKAGAVLPRFFVLKNAANTGLLDFFIRNSGGFIVDPDRMPNPAYRQTLFSYIIKLLENGIPVLYFIDSHLTASENLQFDENFPGLLYSDSFTVKDDVIIVPISINTKNDIEIQNIWRIFKSEVDIHFSSEIFASDIDEDQYYDY